MLVSLRRLYSANPVNYCRSLPVQTIRPAMPLGESSHGAVKFKFEDEFQLHRLANGPSSTTTVKKEELLRYYEKIATIRRMELAADALYKAKMIRGFCHLQIGQEAVPVGIDAAMTPGDALITAYRCHGYTYLRGASVHSILAELLGRETGVSKGKGGSMHMYAENFFGGNGIVGAQVPLGAGIAFAQKYRSQSNVTFALYGDGAANQGQIFEAFNMAALWKLPVVFLCENNFYAMGTSLERSTAATQHYTRGDYLPGIQVNGMDVLAVRQAVEFSRKHALESGPIVLEMLTYRYQGHSMSDPGTSYRTRDEIKSVRETRDTLRQTRAQLLGAKFATEEDIRGIDKRVKSHVDEAVEMAKSDPFPKDETVFKNIYVE